MAASHSRPCSACVTSEECRSVGSLAAFRSLRNLVSHKIDPLPRWAWNISPRSVCWPGGSTKPPWNKIERQGIWRIERCRPDGGECLGAHTIGRPPKATQQILDLGVLVSEDFTSRKADVLIVNEHRDSRHRLAPTDEYAPPFPAETEKAGSSARTLAGRISHAPSIPTQNRAQSMGVRRDAGLRLRLANRRTSIGQGTRLPAVGV